MQVNIKKLSGELGIEIPDLLTRPIGKSMYAIVRKIIEQTGDSEVVELDFDGIRVIDPSFIDEFLVNLIFDSRKGDREYYLKLVNISEIGLMNIASVFSSYSGHGEMRIAVITDRLTESNNYFVGVLDGEERDVVDYLNINRTARADDIASFLEKDVERAETVLAGLHALRIVRKLRDGDRFVYVSL